MTYGMYHCINISSDDEGGGVLIRACEPLEECIETMFTMRTAFNEKRKSKTKQKLPDRVDICRGPSKLCICFNITKAECDGESLASSENLWIETAVNDDQIDVEVTKRIGLSKRAGLSASNMMRYCVKNCVYVSGVK